MSDADNAAFPGFGNLVPGFDFLQNLTKQAASSSTPSLPQMPGLGSWVAPTLNVEDIEKRIQELKAVQFWLDQNATALKATIQALEVQKMTLATLKGMNFNMGEIANAFKIKTPDSAAGTSKGFAGLEVPPSAFQAMQAAAAKAANAQADEGDDDEEDGDEDDEVEESPPPAPAKSARAGKGSKAEAAAPGVVDPMQWWGALTQQFQTIAAEAMKDVAKKAATDAGQGAASEAMQSAAKMAKGMADSATGAVTGGARAMTSALRNQAWPTPAPRSSAAPKTAAKKSTAKKPAAKSAGKTTPKPGAKTARKTTR